MAYIQPNSTVQFFADIGLSPNYENTLYFSSVQNKDNYFGGLTQITPECRALSYSRETRGFIRVEKTMSQLIGAGYMRFKNTSFENKWFYAFVVSIEYINNTTTQVNFELDVMMTWMGGFTLNQCYIERQHTISDAIGANICSEPVDCGEYVTEASSMTAFFGSYKIGVYKSYNASKDDLSQYPISQGTYAPIITYFYDMNSSGLTYLIDLLDNLEQDNRIDEIFCMKLVPEHWCNRADTTPPTDQFSVEKPYTSIGGYVPRNKKLFTYPYKFLQVENCEGDNATYKYEYFNTLPDATSTGYAYFQIMGTSCTPEINIMCTPKDYNGETYAWDEALAMKNFPNVAWNVDMYKAYIAQRDSTLFGKVAANVLTAGIGAAVGSSIGAMGSNLINERGKNRANILSPVEAGILSTTSGTIQSGVSGLTPVVSDVINSMLSGAQPARFANQTRGGSDSNLMVQSRNKNFYFRQKCITKNYAKMIDSFFDMYGYAIKQHGVPNMNARPHWTYVKTLGCSINGQLPSDDAASIEKIFDNGVRFWKNHTEIGKYVDPLNPSYSNAPNN